MRDISADAIRNLQAEKRACGAGVQQNGRDRIGGGPSPAQPPARSGRQSPPTREGSPYNSRTPELQNSRTSELQNSRTPELQNSRTPELRNSLPQREFFPLSACYRRRVSESVHPAILRLRTVCRCNNIKHGTIAKVIDAGARTIAEVARLTTATTGQCGGTCTPRVQEMIEERWGQSESAEIPVAPGEEDAWWNQG